MRESGARKKTSISLPRSSATQWGGKRLLIETNLAVLLNRLDLGSPERETFVAYTRGREPCQIISVYWPLSTYNQLHTLSAATRISVSRIIYLILRSLEKVGRPYAESFLNYGFTVVEWSDKTKQILETLSFSDRAPPLTP